MKRIFATLILLSFFMLSSCMMKYYYNNDEFSSKADAYAAQYSHLDNIKKSLDDPLPEPLSEKKLVIGIPNRETFKKTIVFRGNQTGQSRENTLDYISTSNERDFLAMAEWAKEKNIYKDCEIIRTNGGHLQPSEDQDVLYFFIASEKTMTWYMADQKYGKQTMIPDNGIDDMAERMESWLQSIQAFAIRE